MHDGSEIARLQNTPRYIRLLKAQRQLYSEAKRLNRVTAIVCLAIPVALSLIQVINPEAIPSMLCFWIGMLLFVFGLVLPSLAKSKTKMAASIQQRFDLELYGVGTYCLAGMDEQIVSAAKRYDRIGRSQSDVESWYESVDPSFGSIQAIRCCLRENVNWSFRLCLSWLVTVSSLSLICFAVIFFVVVLFHLDLSALFFSVTILERTVTPLVEGVKSLDAIWLLDCAMKRVDVSDERSIISLQNDIFEARKTGFAVPDWFFRRKRARYSSIGDAIATVERSKAGQNGE